MAVKFAKRLDNLEGSAIRELLKLTQRPEVISFAGGMPAPELFPVEEMKKECDIITKATNNRGAIAEVINKHILGTN